MYKCGGIYRNKAVLKNHIKKEHIESYKCGFCEFCVVRIHDLLKHTKSKHPANNLLQDYMASHNKPKPNNKTSDEILDLTVLPDEEHNMNIQDINIKSEYNSNDRMNSDNITDFNVALEYKKNLLDKKTSVSSGPGIKLAKNNFHCKHCEFIGWSHYSLTNHNMEKHNNRYKCDFCDFSGSKKYLRFHIKKEHSSHICHDEKTKYFKCMLCKYSTFYKHYLTRHYKNTHEELDMLLKEDKNVLLDKSQDLRFKIEEYRLKEAIDSNLKSKSEGFVEIKSSVQNFSNSSNIAASVICGNNRDKNIYYCCLCKYKGHKISLKKHFSDKHEHDLFVCECCTLQGATRTVLSSHTNMKHKRSMWMHCQLCMYKTREESPFFIHFRRKHWNSKHYFCKVCKFSTQIRSDLSIHLDKEHPKVTKEFRCQLCNFYTDEMDDYEKHMMIDHAKIEHLKCEFCFYRTKLKLNLMQHIRDKHVRHNVEKTEDMVQRAQFWENMPTNPESNTKTEYTLVEEEIDLKSEISQQDDITIDVKENLKFYTEENSPKMKFWNGDKKYVFNNITNTNIKGSPNKDNEIHDEYKGNIQDTEFPDTMSDITYLGDIKNEFRTDNEIQDDTHPLEYSESSKANSETDNLLKSEIENTRFSDTEGMVTIKNELDDLFNENMRSHDIIVESKDTGSYQLDNIISNQKNTDSNDICHREEVFIKNENSIKIEPEDLEKVEIDISWT